MAHTMKLRTPVQEHRKATPVVDHIWNISHGVGSPQRERNGHTDVELVQRLIKMGGASPRELPFELWLLIRPSGRVDSVTQLAVRRLESSNELSHGDHLRVSPARRGQDSYAKGVGQWQYFIMTLNLRAWNRNYEQWHELPRACSAALRHELKRPAH